MEKEVKQRHQRHRRRERAQRMQAQRESKVKDGDSAEEVSPARDKQPRPTARRKKSKEPLGEEDIIDGFAIMAFRTYEDLEAAVKCASLPRTDALTIKPRLPGAPRNHPSTVTSHSLTLLQDAGTSDDSGRASERLTGSSVAPRDPDSSRDRLSDASSRCSSGKGYICDSEGDDDKASPENTSPKYHDASMEDVSEAGTLFRVTGSVAGAVATAGSGGKSELAARGGNGGALALSRAPSGGSASPAPAPLPQPAPSPAPAALPPPALPPPPFRADTPHRPSSAHIPALDGHAATQIPAKPVGAAGAGAAGPDTPERPASNNKLQPGARAAADSPTPAPPAPPAPSPLFPSHTAYQSLAAAALPDYRHTNHETRTEPAEPPAAPLDLHAARPAHAAHAAHPGHAPHPHPPPHPGLARAPHPVLPGHDVRNAPLPPAATSLLAAPGRNGVAPLAAPPTNSTCLPNPTLPGRPASPCVPSSRPYPTPSIGSSHVNSSLSSSNHNHSLPYQSQSSLQKHSVQSVYTSRPPHLAPFSVANHIQPLPNQTTAATHASHPMNSHSILNHTSHLHNSITTSTPNHIGQLPPVVSTASSAIPNYASSLKHSGLGLPLHPSSNVPPVSLHTSSNHIDSPATTSAAAVVTSSSILSNSHPLAPPVVDSRQPPSVDSRQPPVIDSRQPPIIDSRQPSALDSRQPSVIDSRQPPIIDSRLPPVADSRQPPVIDSRQPVLVDSRQPSVVESRQAPVSSSELPVRTESPAIASIASNGFPPPAVYSGAGYPPLYAPYATTLQHSPYLPPAAASPRNSADTRTSLSASPLVAPKTPKGVRPHTPGSTGGAAPHSALSYSPRESPSRERESFSSISSLSRGTATATAAVSLPPPLTPHAPPLATSLSSSLVSPLVGPLAAPLAAPTPTPAAAPTSHLAHSLAPVPTVPSISSSAKPPAHWGVTRPTAPDRPGGFAPAPPLFGAPLPPPNPNPFSAESLFQSSPGADLLRRELDNRFLAAAGAGAAARTELHHHQHQHTHVHQHPHHGHAPHATHPAHAAHAAHAPHPPPAPHHHQLLMPHGPLFKDVGKMSSLYRAGLGLGYPYSSSLLHPAAPYVPPAPLTTFAPKPVVSAASDPATKPSPRPAVAKTGKWNAMHVRIAWEIYNHQQKEKTGGSGQPAAALAADKDKLRAFPAPAPPPPFRSPYDLPPAPYLPHHPHLGVSPFGRYAGAFPGAPAAFGLSPYGRELLSSPLHHGVHHAPPLSLHDAWRVRPAPAPAPAPQPDVRRDIDERARRDREERERRDREERERRKQRERDLDRVRVRSPLRNGVPEPPKDERKEMPRAPPTLGAYPPAAWDPYRAAFDPLQHMRFAPLVEAAIRAEEDRAKMFSAYAHHQQLKAGPLLHRGLPPHGPLPPLGVGVGVGAPHGSLAPLPALPHAPLPPHAQLPALGSLHPHAAPLDLLKKEEPR